ncbi:MAG TPA: ATP-dependent 6-phosphofructokinase [Steroidobacteraceae bacterium]|jgi:6-phosphofructokinase 1|nr:ATP-dependent 6-phosphofructokinase [Steroidobacteraceae bacterium]
MKRIAVLTSGGDAPGMNAAVRAVVRCAGALGMEVAGIRNGFTGLIAGDFQFLGARDVGGIIERGGTFLGSTRCEELKTPTGQDAALQQLRAHDIDALIVVGGNGSQMGAHALAQRGVRIVGIASTIDNDLYGAEPSLGATTALDTALEAIDRLRVTASSHKRAFIVEVMGRNCGYLALMAGIAGGAEAIVLPEQPSEPEALADEIRRSYARGKSHALIVVAEGARYNADACAHYFREHAARLGFELRITRLGHVQRGGSPCAFDRLIGTRLGAAASEHLCRGRPEGVLLGYMRGDIAVTPLATVVGSVKAFDAPLYALARTLAE